LRTQGYVRELVIHLQHHSRFSTILTDRYIKLLIRSAPLHDIGKMGIPDSILLKPGSLTSEESQIMNTHARLGSEAIELAERHAKQPLEFLTLAKEITRWHHEKWDGSGYPDGLSGDSIPLSARIMAIADVFDASLSNQTYKNVINYDKVKDIISEGRGTHFDPDMVDIFLENFSRFSDIADQHHHFVQLGSINR
jgi:putative two-component system response regulator